MKKLAVAIALLAGLLLAAVLAPAAALAPQGSTSREFDHLSTGFPLTGQHQSVRCEDCHVRGVFKGTSRRCDACHLQGTPVNAVAMPSTHVPVPQPCEACHTTNSFYGVRFAHTDVTGICESCHSGAFQFAQPKSPNHIPTGTASCDICHSTLSFANAYLTVPAGHIPTVQACSTCHAAGFTPTTTRMNHAGTAGACDQCHAPSGIPYTFTIPAQLVVNGKLVSVTAGGKPVTVVPMSQGGSTTSGVSGTLNHVPAAAACDQCHTNGVFTQGSAFRGGTMHHGAVLGERCSPCHDSSTVFAGTGPGPGGQPFQIPAPVGTPGSSNHMPISGLDCGTGGCHGATDSTTSTGSGFATKITPALSTAGHAAVNLPCATCHARGMTWKLDSTSIVTPTVAHIPPDNSTTPSVACGSCHSATSFGTGGFKITATPVMNVTMHSAIAAAVPLCSSCHEASASDLLFQGVLGNIYLRPDTGTSGLSKGAGLDPFHGTGNAATEDCSVCHSTTPPFTSTALPSNHFAINASAACADCHSAGYGPGISKMKHADVTTATPACGTCHNTSTVFAGTGPGTLGQPWQMSGRVGLNGTSTAHFATGGADCASGGCHSASDTMTNNGASFELASVPALSTAGHATVNLACQSCHAAGMQWKGVASMVGATGAHIPPDNAAAPSLACNSCHASSSFVVGGFKLSGTPGGASAVMTPAMHATVASSVAACESCHEANASDLTFQGVLSNIYLRPNTATSGLSLASDAAHGTGNAASGDCSGCHSTTGPFKGGALPANHIPLNSTSVACADCHASGYAPGVSTMKHADVTTATPSCATCHNTSTVYSGTAQGTDGQPWQMSGAVATAGGTSTTHIPLGSATNCNASGCHTLTDAMTSNGAGFFVSSTNPVLSAAGHATVNLACENCHAVNLSWKGVATLVTPAANHIPPDNTAANVPCSSCHLATSFGSGGFKLSGTAGTSAPVMTVAMHTAVASAVSGCDACHESANLAPADLQFQGIAASIYLRPNNGANSGLSLATDATHGTGNAATADCGGCHSTTPPFSAAVQPSGHIPTISGAACSACHTTAGVYYNVALPMPHTGYVSGTCTSCHDNGGTKYAGSTFTPSASGGGGTFGTQTSGSNFSPKQIYTPVGSAGGHIPLPAGDDCGVCHTSFSAFGPGTAMNHAGISSACAGCHAPVGITWYGVPSTATTSVTNIAGVATVMSPVHVPITGAGGSNDCSTCHVSTTFTSFGPGTVVTHAEGAFMTGTPKGSTAKPLCQSCHNPSGTKFYGVTLTSVTINGHHHATAASDCNNSGCHSVNGFPDTGAAPTVAAARRPFLRRSAGPLPHTGQGPSSGVGAVAWPFTHVGVLPGTCADCHAPTGAATPKPANHLATSASCDSCHRTSSWLPALFLHNRVAAGTCAACHTGNWATAKPARHMLTSRSCDTCHAVTTSWMPQEYAHLDTAYRPHPASVTCVNCHSSGTEQVVWKYPNLKPGCGGCHGPQAPATSRSRHGRLPVQTPQVH